MTALKKFMFEHDFDAATDQPSGRASAQAQEAPEPEESAEPEAPETPPAVYTEDDLEAARAESYQAGHDAGVQAGQAQGREAAETEASQAAQTALRQVAQGLAQIFNGLDDAEARRERQALEIAMTIARRLFPALERRHGMAEVETVVTRSLERLRETPRVMVRAHPDTIAVLEDQRDALAAATGYEGRLKLVPDTGMGASDVSVAWADGTAARDTAAVWTEIDAAIRNALDGADEAEIAAAQGRARPERPAEEADGDPSPDRRDAGTGRDSDDDGAAPAAASSSA